MSLQPIGNINKLPDPLKQYQFTFCISKIRGSDGIAGAFIGENNSMSNSERAERFELQCTSYSWPGSKINTQDVVIAGHKMNRATIQDKSGQWKTTLIETMDGAIITMVRNWMDAIYNPLTGIGLPSTLYISLCEIKMKTPLGEKSVWLRGFYPIAMDNIQIDASSSQPIQCNVTWNYDWFSESKISSLI